MNKDGFLRVFKESLVVITEKRFFSSELGYQGQLVTELNNRLKVELVFSNRTVVEQEYQKRLKRHGIRIRPDIIIHVPYSEGIHSSRKEDNYVVIQLKKNSSKKAALDDFKKIDLLFQNLDYPLGVFLNIGSERNFYSSYLGEYRDRIHCFAVRLSAEDKVIIHKSP